MKSFKTYTIENNITYGRLQPKDEAKIRDDDKIIKYFRENGLLSKYENMSHPNNEQTMKELFRLKDIMKSASDEDLNFALTSENDELTMYKKFIQKLNINVPNNFVNELLDNLEPILFYLKKHHNRARPEQFARAHSIPFQTTIPHTALHPAYPSGHALDSFIMAHYLKILSPRQSQEIDNFCGRMRKSRLHAGLHYESDNEMSRKLAQDIIKHNLIEVPQK